MSHIILQGITRAHLLAPGTHALLDRLEAHLKGTALPEFMQRYDEMKQHYPFWQE